MLHFHNRPPLKISLRLPPGEPSLPFRRSESWVVSNRILFGPWVFGCAGLMQPCGAPDFSLSAETQGTFAMDYLYFFGLISNSSGGRRPLSDRLSDIPSTSALRACPDTMKTLAHDPVSRRPYTFLFSCGPCAGSNPFRTTRCAVLRLGFWKFSFSRSLKILCRRPREAFPCVCVVPFLKLLTRIKFRLQTPE